MYYYRFDDYEHGHAIIAHEELFSDQYFKELWTRLANDDFPPFPSTFAEYLVNNLGFVELPLTSSSCIC